MCSQRHIGATTYIAVYVAWLLLLLGPLDVADPLGVGLLLSWTTVCLIAAAIVWLPELFARGWTNTSMDRALAVYVALVAFSWLRSVDRHVTFVAVLSLLGNLSMFYATVALARRTPWLARAVLLLTVASSALVLIMAFAFHAEQGLLLRPKLYPVPSGWSGYPELGALAVVQFALLLAAILAARGVTSALATTGLLAVNLVELVFLYSRASWVSIAALVAVAAIFMIQGRQVKRLILVGGVVFIVGAAVVAGNPTLRYLTRALLIGQQPGAGAPVGYTVDVASPEMRLQIWRRSLRMIADVPVSGVGPGNFQSVFETKYNTEIMNDGTRGVHAHNLWLQQSAEIGVLGGLAYAAIWLLVLRRSWQQAAANRDFDSLALLFSILAMGTANVTTNIFYLTGSASGRLHSLTWVLFALVCARPLGRRP